jgi:hypothetical protein
VTEKFRFFDSVDGEDERYYTADEFAEYFRQLISSGIFNGGTNLQVTCTGTDMNVQINEGYAWLEGYLYKIDTEPLELALAAADSVLDRIDRVVIRLDKRLEHRYVKAFILKGEPAEEPIAPELTRDENIYEISLAQIRIIAGKSFIGETEITDERFDAKVCGIVNSLIKVDIDHLIEQLEDEWQTWFDNVKDSTYVINDDFIPVKNTTNNLIREVANLKLYQEATQRIENGVVFGDNFIGEPMGMEFDADLNTLYRTIGEGIYLHVEEQISPSFHRTSYEEGGSSGETNWNSRGMASAYGGTSTEATQIYIESDFFDVTNVKRIEIEAQLRRTYTSNANSYSSATITLLDEEANVVRTYNVPSNTNDTRMLTFDVSDVTGMIKFRFRAYAVYLGRALIDAKKINLVFDANDEETISYKLDSVGNEVVVFVTKEGSFDIDGYLNGNLMEKSIQDDEYKLYKRLSEKTFLTLELVTRIETHSESNRVTRIIGGVAR